MQQPLYSILLEKTAAAPTQKVVQQPLVPSDLAEILNGLISNPMNLVKILVQQPSRNRIIERPPCIHYVTQGKAITIQKPFLNQKKVRFVSKKIIEK